MLHMTAGTQVEERWVVQELVHLAAVEPGKNCIEVQLNGVDFPIPLYAPYTRPIRVLYTSQTRPVCVVFRCSSTAWTLTSPPGGKRKCPGAACWSFTTAAQRRWPRG